MPAAALMDHSLASRPPEAALVDLHVLDLRVEGRCRHSQRYRRARRTRDLAARLRQGGFDDLLLLADQMLVERSLLRLHRDRAGSKPMLIHREFFRVTEDHRPLDHVLQLADVSGPVVRLQQIEALLVDAAEALPGFGRETVDEVLDQHRNVFAAFPQRRYLDGKDVQAVEQIAPEGAG